MYTHINHDGGNKLKVQTSNSIADKTAGVFSNISVWRTVNRSVQKCKSGCIAPKDISIIRKSERLRGGFCCLFEGFMDYLSYLTLVKLGRITEGSESMDYIVLNSVSNVSRVIEPIKKYEIIHCHLDNDDAGRWVVDTLQELLGNRVCDMFTAYPLYKDLNDFLRDKKKYP